MTKARYYKFLKSRDRRLREDSYVKFLDAYGAMKNTLAANMDANVKNHVFFAGARKHAGTLEAALHPDGVPPEVFHSLIDTVSRQPRHHPPLHRPEEEGARPGSACGNSTWPCPCSPRASSSSPTMRPAPCCWRPSPRWAPDYVATVKGGHRRRLDRRPRKRGQAQRRLLQRGLRHAALHPAELGRRAGRHLHPGPRAGPLDALLAGGAQPALRLRRLSHLHRRGGLDLQRAAGDGPSAEDRSTTRSASSTCWITTCPRSTTRCSGRPCSPSSSTASTSWANRGRP